MFVFVLEYSLNFRIKIEHEPCNLPTGNFPALPTRHDCYASFYRQAESLSMASANLGVEGLHTLCLGKPVTQFLPRGRTLRTLTVSIDCTCHSVFFDTSAFFRCCTSRSRIFYLMWEHETSARLVGAIPISS